MTRLGLVYHIPFWRAADGTLSEAEGSFARYVESLAPYFDEIVLCVPVLREATSPGSSIRAANVTLAPLAFFDGPAHFYPRLPLMLPSLVRFVRRIDLLHCRVPTPVAIFVFALARLLRRRSFLLVVGDLEALRPTLPYLGVKKVAWHAYTAFEERSIQWMVDRSLTFANGASLAQKHSRPGRPVIETRTTTIHLSDIASREDACNGARARILTVSRIDPRKGLRVLPDAIKRLVARGFDVELDIIGTPVGAPGEAERREIQARAVAGGVADRVRLLGGVPLDRLLSLYGGYDLFVLPTLPGEGIPRVLLEAMTNGLPVVTTRVAGIPSLVTHEWNGLLIDEPSPSTIADAVGRVISEVGLRRQLIANGYETARRHTLEAQAARMMHDVASRLDVTLRQPAAAPPALTRA